MGDVNNPNQMMQMEAAGAAAAAAPNALQQMLEQQTEQIHILQQQLQQRDQQMHQQQQQLQQQQQQIAQPIDLGQLANLLAQQAERQSAQARDNTHQLIAASRMGPPEPFDGKIALSSTGTAEWVTKTELRFAASEAAGLSETARDASRLTAAAACMRADALRWYQAIPSAEKPKTWEAFKAALMARFSSSTTAMTRLEQLRKLVSLVSQQRAKLAADGWQAFLARFQELSGEIPGYLCTQHGLLEMLGRALPERLAQLVWAEHRKRPDQNEPLKPMHVLIAEILAKAYSREYATNHAGGASSGGGSAAAASAAPMAMDAVLFCAATFDVSQETARGYLEEGEGWQEHDTSGGKNSAAGATGGSGTIPAESAIERLLAAFESRFTAGNNGGAKGSSSRRNMPSDVKRDVPAALAEARKTAGLCIKCGVTKYEPGSRGHNSRNCNKGLDKTTSAQEGLRKAGGSNF